MRAKLALATCAGLILACASSGPDSIAWPARPPVDAGGVAPAARLSLKSDELRIPELTRPISKFSERLVASGLVASVNAAASVGQCERILRLELDFEGEDLPFTLRNVSRAAAVILLTGGVAVVLGLVPPMEYGYRTAVALDSRRWDGSSRSYAATGEAAGSAHPFRAGAIERLKSTVRERAIELALASSLEQVLGDADWWAPPPGACSPAAKPRAPAAQAPTACLSPAMPLR
jgi:hypothetical protein